LIDGGEKGQPYLVPPLEVGLPQTVGKLSYDSKITKERKEVYNSFSY
jgi:hypothetical protein